MDLNEIDYELGLFLASAPGMVPEASSCQIQSTSAADLSPRREVKGARRVRNACLQCRQRKIRCSRTYPCKGCVSRGDGAACDWQGGFPTGNIPVYQKHAADQRRQIEKLKDRLTCAKACLGSALKDHSDSKLEGGLHQTRSRLILPISPREETLSWYSTGSNDQPPGSALSHMSSFSTNTVDSSQGWSHEDVTSPLSADIHSTIWKEGNPSRLFEIRHKSTGYRPLSLLRKEGGLAVDGSRLYTTAHEDCTRASVSANQFAPEKKTYWGSNISDSITPNKRVPTACATSNSMGFPEVSTPEAKFGYPTTSHTQEGMPALHRIPSLTSFPPHRSDWNSSGFNNARPVHNSERQSANQSEVEFRSPITPSRNSLGFSLPYISSLIREEEISPGGVRNMCQHYLPQRQYPGGQDIDPATGPSMFNSRDLPWNTALSPNLEQRIQANVALGLMNMGEQYSLLPSGLSSAPTTGTSQVPAYNSNLSGNWPPAPR